jgi:hypothetical protein
MSAIVAITNEGGQDLDELNTPDFTIEEVKANEKFQIVWDIILRRRQRK